MRQTLNVKIIGVLQSKFLDHNEINLEIHNRITGKSPSIWKLNTTLVWIKATVSRDIRKHFELNKNGNII